MKKSYNFITKWVAVGLIGILMCGCGSDNKKGEQTMVVEEMDWMTIGYSQDSDTSIEVTIDFEENKKEKRIISKGITEEVTSYDKCEEIKKFVKDRIVGGVEDGKTGVAGNSDDKKVLWSIQIVSGDESVNLYGYEDYPEYWDDLMELIEENISTE